MFSIGFEITVDIGTKILDVFLDLSLNIYCPYCKPNSETNFNKNNSDNSKNICNMIEKRLCKLSKNEEVFNKLRILSKCIKQK